MMAGLIKGIIHEDSWDLCTARHSSFIFETEEGDTKVDGFVLLKKILMNIQPEIVVDMQDREKLLESLTLEKCGNNVQTLTRTMEKTWNEIKTSYLAPTMRAGSSLSSSEHSRLLATMISFVRGRTWVIFGLGVILQSLQLM